MNHDLLDFGISMICFLCLQNFALNIEDKTFTSEKNQLNPVFILIKVQKLPQNLQSRESATKTNCNARKVIFS